MKKLYLLTYLLFLQVGVSAQQQIIPCEFTWQALKLPNGSVADYTSPQRVAQPYQGPCVAFALAAAVESQFEIDYNRPNANLNLDEAYLDFSIFWWDTDDITGTFSKGFSIPPEGAGQFPRFCDREGQDCWLLPEVQDCLEIDQCFRVEEEFLDGEWEETVVCMDCPAGTKVRAQRVEKVNNQVSSMQDLKLRLMNEGPLVLKMNGHNRVNDFFNYNASSDLAFHAVTIIGWRDVPGGVQWHVKDSWPGSANSAIFKYSKALSPSTLLSYISDGLSDESGYELFQVVNTQLVNVGVFNPNPLAFSPADQCTRRISLALSPPTIHALFLNEATIIRNQYTTVIATLNCNGEAAVDWEWSIPNSGLYPINMNACDSNLTFYTNASANSMEIKVRAKASNGLWSPWRSRTFMVTNNQF